VPDLNQPAPELELPDLQGASHRLSDYRGRIVVLNFWSGECPWSERADRHLLEVLQPWAERAALLSVASNANEPEDLIRTAARQRGVTPILRDSAGSAARLYGARATPHAFVIDEAGILRYQGAVDDVTFRQRRASRWYIREAIEALLHDRLPALQEAPPYGCSIVFEI
jgi:peroxiredoxin